MNVFFKTLLFFTSLVLLAACHNRQNASTGSLSSSDSTSASHAAIIRINDQIGIAGGYTFADTVQRDDDNIFAYGTFISLPKLYNKSGEFDVLNSKITSDFDSVIKAASAKPKANKDEYHRISYDYYLHDSIITVKITDLYAWHLSEASTAFAVYHFDYKNNKLLTTQEMFAVFGLSQVPVLSAFAEQCTMPPDNTDPLFKTEWFNKVKFNDINQLKFYVDNDQKIAIIYPLVENGIEAEQIIE